MGRRGATQTLGSPTLVGRPSQKGAGGRGRMLNPAMSPRRLPAVVPPPSPRPAGARGRWHAVAGAPTRAGAAAILGPPTARETSGGRRTAGGSRDRGDAVATAAKRGGGAWGHPRCPPAGGLPWGMGTFCYGGGGGLGDTVPLGTPGWGAWGHCAMGGYHTPSAPFPVLPILSAPSPRFQYPQSPFPVLPILNTPSPHSQCSLFPVLPVPTPSAPTRTHMEAIRGLIFAPL